jgi:heme/copper-type cytochrome/quinol oxidase subunit 2
MLKRKLLLTLIFLCIIIPVVHAANWQSVKNFMGTSDQNTDNFTITATEWKIHWTYTPRSDYSYLSLFSFNVYEKGGQIKTLYILKTGANETSGTEYIHGGQKDYFLVISVANLAGSGYTITVGQNADTIPSIPTTSNPTVYIIIIVIIIVAIILAVLLLKRRRKPKQPLPPPPS